MLFVALAFQTIAPFAHIKSAEIDESSGLVASRTRKGVFYTHNDSGDSARIWAIDLTGRVIQERKIEGATNVDWEDIAIDGSTIWIDDAGNNGNARRDLCLYAVQESKGVATRFPIRYPDQTEFPPKGKLNFDCEAIFIRDHKPFLITKWRVGRFPGMGASLYRMDTRSTKSDNVLLKLDTKENLEGWVTAADLSPNGKELAVLCHLPIPSIWIFDATKGEKILSHPIARRKLGKGLAQEEGQIESLAWNGNEEIIFGNEGGDLFRIDRKAFPKL